MIVADSTRINEGIDRLQVVLYVKIPFKYSEQECKIYQEIQKTLDGESFSYTVKLMAGTRQALRLRAMSRRKG